MNQDLHDKIIKIDQEHIREYYQGDRIVCDICQPNREKGMYYKKNARFIVMEYGVVLSCRRCKQSYPLNKYLEKANKNHIKHSIERWEIGSTGWNFDCPHPPKEFSDALKKLVRREYKKREEDLKKQNYLKKYGKLP